MTNKIKKTAGFTLLEMIVALGIFVIIVTMALGSILQFKDIQRKTSAINQIQGNLRFAIEFMAKEMRTGKTYSCPNCGGGSEITFKNARGETIVYKLENDRFKKAVNGGSFIPLTSPNIKINSLEFFASGLALGDGFQPRILIKVKSSIKTKNETININLQTLVSSRQPDM